MTQLSQTIATPSLNLQPMTREPAFQRHSATSEAAAMRNAPKAGSQGLRVLHYLIDRGADGATDEEMQLGLPMGGNTQRPRRVALCRDGFVKASGRTRATIGGDQAVVWVVA